MSEEKEREKGKDWNFVGKMRWRWDAVDRDFERELMVREE